VDLRVEGVRDVLRRHLVDASRAYLRRDLQAAGAHLLELIGEVRTQRGKALTVQASAGLETLTRQAARLLDLPLGGRWALGLAAAAVLRGRGGGRRRGLAAAG
jgi:uncharacterized membrane protein